MTEVTSTLPPNGDGYAVYTSPGEEALSSLKQLYPDAVVDDEREGYEGVVVAADRLLDVAQLLRDELGFNFLSSVTGVDLIEENKMEVVYHVYSISNGGGALVFKVQTDRDDPVVPSLTPLWPGAELQEREAYDLLGIEFEGHPDLRRILTWDGFNGHPLRKDYEMPLEYHGIRGR